MLSPAEAGAAIRQAGAQIAARMGEQQFRRHPGLAARFGARGRARCEEDARFHLSYLAEATALGEPTLFSQYVAWAASVLESRGVAASDLRVALAAIPEILGELVPEALPRVEPIVTLALAGLERSTGPPEVAVPEAAQRYLEAALHQGPLEAGRVVDELLAAGAKPADIYAEVLHPALHELGRLWQLNRISVAEEHYGTAVTQRVMARLYSDSVATPPRGPLVVVACVAGNLHELGARMLCDVLQLAGYRTDYLGATTPAAPLVEYVCKRGARFLALSATLAPQLVELRETLQLLRADARCRDIQVLVGGGAFNALPSIWRLVGADAWAPDARSALAEINVLAARAHAPG